MDHGTGVDIWFDPAGVLAEERHMLDGERHGYERWWHRDNQTILDEGHFQHGIEHGIFRRWSLNKSKSLSRGYPQYFIQGKHVTKRQYERACRTDPTLLPFRKEDNLPSRSLPDLSHNKIG